ncbi:uncharacterized protein BDR25DRAFT_355015 [Lindgomyces ingoldianus]|uniref:Uncharacterized protein n=1 Tax=Lindgomyces ingoldianus TaxID=673940 RepID=A0ACB6QW57_9PLEO|nr:uncharacterized protein BDR25DRAFT_355015 [Lindgomyces ingoldianus]KAF2471105.1 hypothetical protein BDR25DRAFT_355015 [Lindgomyces ingoldianus]
MGTRYSYEHHYSDYCAIFIRRLAFEKLLLQHIHPENKLGPHISSTLGTLKALTPSKSGLPAPAPSGKKKNCPQPPITHWAMPWEHYILMHQDKSRWNIGLVQCRSPRYVKFAFFDKVGMLNPKDGSDLLVVSPFWHGVGHGDLKLQPAHSASQAYSKAKLSRHTKGSDPAMITKRSYLFTTTSTFITSTSIIPTLSLVSSTGISLSRFLAAFDIHSFLSFSAMMGKTAMPWTTHYTRFGDLNSTDPYTRNIIEATRNLEKDAPREGIYTSKSHSYQAANDAFDIDGESGHFGEKKFKEIPGLRPLQSVLEKLEGKRGRGDGETMSMRKTASGASSLVLKNGKFFYPKAAIHCSFLSCPRVVWTMLGPGSIIHPSNPNFGAFASTSDFSCSRRDNKKLLIVNVDGKQVGAYF